MLDYNAYLSTQIRHLAFRKSSEPATWQAAFQQKQATDIENRLGKFNNNHFLMDLTKVLLFKFNQWRRSHHQAPALITDLPSHHKAA